MTSNLNRPTVNTIFFDFDSTLVTVESFDEVLARALADADDTTETLSKIEELTALGMSGAIDLKESLHRRFALARIHESHFQSVAQTIPERITPGIAELIGFLRDTGQQIFILSGGFLTTILPVAKALGIPARNCFANTYRLDHEHFVSGIDEDNPLTTSAGKIAVIRALKSQDRAPGKRFIVGDGESDARPFLCNEVDFFCGFGVNVARENVRKSASRFFRETRDLHRFFETTLAGDT